MPLASALVYPITPAGRFIGGATAIVGIGFFALPAGIIGSGFVEVVMEEKAQESERVRREASERRLRTGGSAPASLSDEALVLEQAAAALRRQEATLALSLIEERLAALGRI